MKYKKIMLILITAIFLASIAGVSAADANDTLVASEDTSQIELSDSDKVIEDNLQTSEENPTLAVDENDETLSYEINSEILTADQFTYSNLREQIGSGGNINLTKGTYTYNGDGDTIEITTSGVINGNGAVIDMANSGHRAFYVTASGVTIKNLTIKNANYNGDGGAIYFSSSGTVSNCNFTDNTASQRGGAIMIGGTGTVTNCNFTNNKASVNGGAILMTSGSVENCNFTNNTASRYGGAVIMGSGTVTNCNFTNNKASGDGGAIRMTYGSVENCNFTDNSAEYGGAIRFKGEGTVSNCNFTNNQASVNGGAVYFQNTGTVTNCNFIDNQATGSGSWGGAIMIGGTGTVTNCNFTNNSAVYGGAIWISSGSVENCNFTGNKAYYGGAIYFTDSGITHEVRNCNFTNNQATGTNSRGGAIMFLGTSNVTNCNFIDNQATGSGSWGGAIMIGGTGNVTNCNFTNNHADYGGAIRFSGTGTVSNCNFVDNSASRGGAIFSQQWYTSADTCIFKGNSGEDVNIVIYPPALNVNNFTTFYGSGEKLTFDLRTNLTSIPVTNGNISIIVYFKDNNSWVGNYSCLSGEGWIPNLPVGSYYAIFNTEYAGFQAINRTITVIIPAGKYYVNVTSLSTNNKTVNITAKTNVPNNITWDVKLLFILPNGENIIANYTGNGTWWAVHTFNEYEYGVYGVSASYAGLDNVTIYNAAITITKCNSTITLDKVVLDYGDSIKVNVKTEGALAIIAMIDGEEVGVFKYAIPISGLNAGIHTLTVTTIPDYGHVEVTKTVNITVNKVDSTLTVEDIEFDYNGAGSAAVSFTGATGVNASVVGHDEAKVNVDGNTITVSGLNAGTYNLTVATIADANHNNITKTAKITVNKLKTELKASAISTTYNINRDLVISLTDAKGNPLSGVIITVNLGGGKFTTDKNGQVKINVANLVPKTYTAKITFNGNTKYDKSTKDVKVTVTKATPKLTAKSKKFKKSKKVKKYTVTLKDNTGKAMKKVQLTIKVGKKTFKAKTNAKGKAVFKIKNLKKKGKYRATVKFSGNTYYNKVTKKVKITVK